MTDTPLRERVAKAICQEKCAFYGEPPCWGLDPEEYVIKPWNPDDCDEPGCGALADAAIALVLEEAARSCEEVAASIQNDSDPISAVNSLRGHAVAIRALKDRPVSPSETPSQKAE